MSLMNWLQKKLSGDETAQLTFAPGEEQFAGLNLKEVINAHLNWNERLKNYLNETSDESLDVHHIAPDDLCVLGKWIYGPGAHQFGKYEEFKNLKHTHKHFHLLAGEIVDKFNSGESSYARTLLKSDFRALSNHIQLSLVRLYASAN